MAILRAYVAPTGGANEVIASSASRADVQSAVNTAVDGDTVIIPNGSSTWTDGITTTKQIRIEAQNMTPSEVRGRKTQNVTITCNSSNPIFSLTSGNTYHVGLAGIRAVEGTTEVNLLRLNGTGSKVPLIHDCSFEWGNRQSGAGTEAIWLAGLGGIFWDCWFEGTATLNNTGSNIRTNNSVKDWDDDHTLGMDDDGTINTYFEDCTFHKAGLCPDIDLGGRVVVRHSEMDGTWIETHGFSSSYGGVHYEVYECDLTNDAGMDLSGQWSWVRQGVAILHHNDIDNTLDGYAAPGMTHVVETGSATNGSYPYYKDSGAIRSYQTGWGYKDGAAHRLGCWMWDNTGPNASVASDDSPNATFDTDIFLDSGPPTDETTYGFDYQPFPYPHPLRDDTKQGIAAQYPGDTNISNHADVIFADDFESYSSLSDLTTGGPYDSYYQSANLAFDTSVKYSGSQSLRMRMPSSGSEVTNALVYGLTDTDKIYVRVYQRLQSDYSGMSSSSHNGIRLTGRYTGPGAAPDGTDFFLVNLEHVQYQSEGEPGWLNAYVYHPEQDDDYGEVWYPDGTTYNGSQSFGSNFVSRSKILPARGEWTCYEVMVQLNTPGARDGRVTAWMDGDIVSDWIDLRFRDSGHDVYIDELQLENGGQSSSQINDKWYDNLVIASSYIGPMA